MRRQNTLRLIMAAAAAALTLPVVARAAQPCLSATDACVQWVALGRSGARSMVYATYPLDAPTRTSAGR